MAPYSWSLSKEIKRRNSISAVIDSYFWSPFFKYARISEIS
jgi:hypothetical protein